MKYWGNVLGGSTQSCQPPMGTTWLQAPPSPHVLTLTKSWAKCCQGESSQLSACLYQKLLVPESVAKAIAEGMSFSSFPCTSNQRIKQILQNCSSSSFPLADTQQQGKEGDLPEHGVQIPALAPSPTLFVWVRVFISNYAISLTVQRPFSRASPHNLWLLEPMEKSLWWAMLQGWCNEGTATMPEGHPAVSDQCQEHLPVEGCMSRTSIQTIFPTEAFPAPRYLCLRVSSQPRFLCI